MKLKFDFTMTEAVWSYGVLRTSLLESQNRKKSSKRVSQLVPTPVVIRDESISPICASYQQYRYVNGGLIECGPAVAASASFRCKYAPQSAYYPRRTPGEPATSSSTSEQLVDVLFTVNITSLNLTSWVFSRRFYELLAELLGCLFCAEARCARMMGFFK